MSVARAAMPWRAEFKKTERDLEKVVDAVLAGVPFLTLKERMEKLEARELEMTALLADAPQDKPDLLPGPQ